MRARRILLGIAAGTALLGASCEGRLAQVPLYKGESDDAGAASTSSFGGNFDAGEAHDGSAEFGGPERCEVPAVLPTVSMAQSTCTPRAGTNCVPDLWFCMSKWSPYYYDGERFISVRGTYGKREPRQIIWTPRYTLDTYPVSNEQYAAYVQQTGVQPVPEKLPFLFDNPNRPELPPEAQPTGWKNGTFDRRRLGQPVVGVSRIEAQRYCEAKGGRLPSVVEILRAAQPNDTLSYRYPWGSFFPFRGGNETDVPRGFQGDVLPSGELPLVSFIDTGFYSDVGPFGTQNLATSISEWLSTCEEEVRAELVGLEPKVFVARPFAERCQTGVLTSYKKWVGTSGFDGQVVHAWRGEGRSVIHTYLGDRLGQLSSGVFSGSATVDQVPGDTTVLDPGGNQVRHFNLGFRCAYDAP
jgi:hypothetical protein